MRQFVAQLIPVLFVGGCSLIYNASNIDKPASDATDAPHPDAEMTADARIDAPPLFDANPSMLALEDVAPNVIYEGQGQGGSRKALLVIRGHHIVPDGLTVSITPSAGLTPDAPMVSMNGDFIAVPVAIAISGTDTGSSALTITVMQNGGPVGGVALTGKLSLNYLPQFPAGTSIAAGSLAALYSEVNTTSNITITGSSTEPALIRSVSQIKIGNITASGAAGATNGAGAAGPGACAGGEPAANAPCLKTEGGGVGAGGNAGGGGGGFAVGGNPGVAGTSAGGAGGDAHGEPQIVSYATNKGAGGGGGGKGALSNSGGGGGGGGTVELTAGGNIVVGTVTARGGDGGAGSSLINIGASGGGGGGSGGTVILRSEAGSVAAGAINVSGGAAGMTGGAGAGGGGAGAAGRVRVDVAGSAPSNVHRGPAFATSTSTIVTSDNIMLTMSGATDDIVDAYVIDADDVPHFGEPMNLKFVNSALMFTPTLLPGYNRFCVTLRPGTRGDSLADKCVDIAYLP